MRASAPGPPAPPVTYDRILQHSAVEHMRSMVSASDGVLCSFSCIADGEATPGFRSAVESLESFTWPGGGKPAAVAPAPDGPVACGMEVDIDAANAKTMREAAVAAASAVDAHTWVFFKVLHSNPSRMKTARLPLASGGRLGKDDVAVTIHAAQHIDGESFAILNDPVLFDNCAVVMMHGLERCSSNTLLNCLHFWKVGSQSHYGFQCLPGEDWARQHSVVSRLIAAGAFPDADKHLHVDGADVDAGILAEWAALGLVTRSPPTRAGKVQVAFADRGVQNLSVSLHASCPRPLCAVREGDISLEDRSTFELILMLQNLGRTWRKLPTAKAHRLALNYSPGGEKTWYSHSVHPERRYLLALLQADELFGAGVTHVPHWAAQPARVYGQILNGSNPTSLLTLVGDVDMGARPAGAPEGAGGPEARRGQWANETASMT